MTKRLKELSELGQSIWYDNIRRGMLTNGEFEELIAAGVLGVTSNPTIFEKAIAGSTDYDTSLVEFFAAGLDLDTIYEKLVLEDIAAAADHLIGVRVVGWSYDSIPEVTTNIAIYGNSLVEIKLRQASLKVK